MDADTPRALGDRFIEAQGRPIEVGGQLVHMSFEWPVPPTAEALEVSVLKTSAAHRQALNLSTKGVELEINGQAMSKAIVWVDSAPPKFVVKLIRGKGRSKPPSVNFWNSWQNESGTVHAWIGNADILIESTDDSALLKCSDGGGEVDFESLIVSVKILGQQQS